MFDPTIYDNLKVGFENALYDLDNLDEIIQVTGRKDIIEMAAMSRELVLQCCLRGQPEVTAEVILKSSLSDLAAEILEMPDSRPGCHLQLRYELLVQDPGASCPVIHSILDESWPGQRVELEVHYTYGGSDGYRITADVHFVRTVNEEQMEDITELCDHMIQVLPPLLQLSHS